jgi:hypothetical protein
MKKLILLVTAGLFCAQVQAQSVKSMVFVDQSSSKARQINDVEPTVLQKLKHANHSANKTTTVGGSDWFSFGDIMYSSGSSKYYYNPMANDSNVVHQPTTGSPNNIFEHGFGLSFDPTDSVFHGGDGNLTTSMGPIGNSAYITDIRVTKNNAYTVDSIRFPFKYYRKDNSAIDTMIITVVKTPRGNSTGPGVYSFTGSTTGRSAGVIVINPANNKADSVPGTATVIKKVMDATFAADTTTTTNATGYSNYTINGIALPSTISMSAGDLLVIYVTVRFKSYPLGTNESVANTGRFYSYDFLGASAAPRQCVGSFMAGLSNDNHTIYHAPASDTMGFHYQGHNITIPSVFYVQDGSFTDIDVKVTCSTCPVLNVANLNVSNIASVTAYPNPTNADVSINFNLKEAANTTVSISNAVGQVLATQNLGMTQKATANFNTDKLANGIYFYTVDANGQRQTNRFVVSH